MSILKDVREREKLQEQLLKNITALNEGLVEKLQESAEQTLGRAYVALKNDQQIEDADMIAALVLLTDEDTREALNISNRQMSIIANYDTEEQKRVVVRKLKSLANHPSLQNSVQAIVNQIKEDPQQAIKTIGKARLVYARI